MCIFFEFLLCLTLFLHSLSSRSLLFVYLCVVVVVVVVVLFSFDPFSLLTFSVFIPFIFSKPVFHITFFTNLLNSVYSTLPFNVLFAFCSSSFLLLA